jgi:hypothetical protein
MRRSFRTHRLCGIPGVSPRAGMRCPVGAPRTPHLPRAFLPRPNHHAAAGSVRSEHWKRTPNPLAQTRTRLGTQFQPVERDLLLETQWIPEGAPGGSGTRAVASIGTSTSSSPSRGRAKAQLAPTFPASAGPIPRSPHRQQAPGASPGTPPSQRDDRLSPFV